MRLSFRVALCLAVAAAAPLAAQSADTLSASRPDSTVQSASLAPSADIAPVDAMNRTIDPRLVVKATESHNVHAPLAAQKRAGLGQGAAMMVVGLGALLAGAIIGGKAGTIFMVGGAVIGLVGLYDYLQ